MKLGILSFAHLHAEAYIQNIRAIPNVHLLGIADEDMQRGRHFAELFDAPLYDGYADLLADGPDGVLVCSENSHHRPLVEIAAAAGVHVLCEKPLATRLEDARAIIDVCRRHNVKLMTAFPIRFSAPFRQVSASLAAGDLGDVYCINATNQGQMPIAHRDWFVDPELAGGGALMDHIVHLADIFNWFFGPHVTQVYAQSNDILHAGRVEVETGGLAMLTFADGKFATIDASWSKPLNYPTWGGLSMEIISERGLTLVDGFRQNLNVYRQEPAGHDWLPWGSDSNQAMIEEFVAAIREDRPPAVTGEDGLFALQVVLAAYQSARTGQPVALEG